MTKNNTQSGLKKLWNFLVGPAPEFSSQNRTVNALSVITLGMLLALIPSGLASELTDANIMLIVLVVLESFFYYLSRVRRKYMLAVVLFAITSYAALIANYHYNSGITGPTLLVFFLTFHLLLAVTPKKLHGLWALLHIIVGMTLIWSQYLYPQWVPLTYKDDSAKYIDYTGTYIISLGFVYLITNYLLNKYNKEKEIAAAHLKEIEEQNKKLKEIAWMQSHKVRNHVTTIMGLTQLFNEVDVNDPINGQVIKGIMTTSKELDEVVKDINALTENDDDSLKNLQ